MSTKEMSPIKVGLIGLGTVGSGVVDILIHNANEISRRSGREIQVSLVCVKHIDKKRSIPSDDIKLVSDPFAVTNHADIDIICELTGVVELAREIVFDAIENGKHVVTVNKALIALHGNEIFAAAHSRRVMVAFEAAVAGGIPIIKVIREGLAANQIEWIAGIINGTSNFILTRMRDEGREYSEILREAKSLGYAEPDPTFDVEGIDAAHKFTILASIAFGIPIQFEKIYIEGINDIEQQDIAYASELGYRIKHLGITRNTAKGLELRVHPTLIPEHLNIAGVEGVMNALMVQTDVAGPMFYSGAGAGSKPTASSVVADIVDVVRVLTSDPENRVPHLAFQPDALSDIRILSIEKVEIACYLRMQMVNRPGALADVSKILGNLEINIETILQKGSAATAAYIPVIILTQRVQEKKMNEAISQIQTLESIVGDVVRIRLETLDG